jgi:hypothetical protein
VGEQYSPRDHFVPLGAPAAARDAEAAAAVAATAEAAAPLPEVQPWLREVARLLPTSLPHDRRGHRVSFEYVWQQGLPIPATVLAHYGNGVSFVQATPGLSMDDSGLCYGLHLQWEMQLQLLREAGQQLPTSAGSNSSGPQA